MTTDQTDQCQVALAAEPLALRLNDQLGPEERAKLDALLDHIYEYGTTAEGVLLRAAQLCQAARAAERERCATICESMKTKPPGGEPEDVERGYNAALRRAAKCIRGA